MVYHCGPLHPRGPILECVFVVFLNKEDSMAQTGKPTISVDAGNDVPGRRFTSLGVWGENFPAGTAVNILVEKRRGTAMVQADGSFQWSTSFKPPLACGSNVGVTVSGADGIALDGSSEVFCP
jgi:hypothetical protein